MFLSLAGPRSGHGPSRPPHGAAAALWRGGPADGAAEQLPEGRAAECDNPQPHTPHLPPHCSTPADQGGGFINTKPTAFKWLNKHHLLTVDNSHCFEFILIYSWMK